MSALGHPEIEEVPQSTGRWWVSVRERTLGRVVGKETEKIDTGAQGGDLYQVCAYITAK